MTFFSGKYKIRYEGCAGDKSEKILQVGTVFVVNCIQFNSIELRPIDNRFKDILIGVDSKMLEFAFSETEVLNSSEPVL